MRPAFSRPARAPYRSGASTYALEHRAFARLDRRARTLAEAAVLTVAVTWLGIECGADASLFATRVSEAAHVAVSEPMVALTLLWTGVVTTAGCAYAEANCLGALTSSEATVIFASEPLWAAAFAWATLGETMGPSAMLGGGLIVGACLVSALGDTAFNAAALSAEGRSTSGLTPAFVTGAWEGATTRWCAAKRAVGARAIQARRALRKDGGGPAVVLLSIVSPAAVEAIETLGGVGSDITSH